MQREKILLIANNNLGLGGIQNVIMNIVRNLSNQFVFDVVCFDSGKAHFDDEFESYGGKIFRLRKKTTGSFLQRLDFYTRGIWLYSAIKKIIKAHGPYIAVHTHKEAENGLILKAAKKCKVRVRIAHAHTAFQIHCNPIAKRYLRYLKKLIVQNATEMVCCSEKAGELLFGENQTFRVVYNTIDRNFLSYDNHQTNEKTVAPVLLQVGMICKNKNQKFSIEVLSILKKDYPNAELRLIGAPKDTEMENYLRELQEAAKSLQISDSVRFLPADSEVKKEMESADYLLLPSFFEGLGITIIEGQALGIRCFVSQGVPPEADCGGCVFLDLESGAKAWADKIRDQYEKDHGQRNRFDISKFHPDVIMEQYRKLYNGEAF